MKYVESRWFIVVYPVAIGVLIARLYVQFLGAENVGFLSLPLGFFWVSYILFIISNKRFPNDWTDAISEGGDINE